MSEPPSPPVHGSPPLAGQQERIRELAAVFLKLGLTAFGGPVAHIAMMEEEVVKRRQWIDRQRFLDLMGAAQLIPGPNSTELAIHLGLERGGWLGLIVAGSCFILPAMIMVWGLAMVYTGTQSIPEVTWILYGIKPVIVAIVLQALLKLGRTACKNAPTALAAAFVVALSAFGKSEILLLLGSGIGVWAAGRRRPDPPSTPPSSAGLLPLGWLGVPLLAAATTATTATAASGGAVFWIFLKIGSVLYGSGYVLLAFLEQELVQHRGWLTLPQLLDAVAIGQMTPGPVFTTATFIGYLVAGHTGALAATVGIFLPGFLLVAATHSWITQLRRSASLSAFLDGVNAASLGLMVVVTAKLTIGALVDPMAVLIFAATGVALWRFTLNSTWLVASGALMGLLVQGLKSLG